MKPILAVVHIYYVELWDELKSCLKNITVQYDLYVTLVENNAELEKDILQFCSEAHIVIVENRGYDIAPFIHVLNSIDLDKYSYIIKLHTKRNVNDYDMKLRSRNGSGWRKQLLHFLKDKSTFQKYLDAFENEPSIGMQNSISVIVSHDIYDKKAFNDTKKWIKSRDLPELKFSFIGGAMFIARASIFKDLQRLNLSISDFNTPDANHSRSLAHIMERLFGYFIYKNNMIVADGAVSIEKNLRHQQLQFLWSIVYFFFSARITRRGWLLIKICKIPIPFDIVTNGDSTKYKIHKTPIAVFEVRKNKDKNIYKIFGIPCFFKRIKIGDR